MQARAAGDLYGSAQTSSCTFAEELLGLRAAATCLPGSHRIPLIVGVSYMQPETVHWRRVIRAWDHGILLEIKNKLTPRIFEA